MINKFHNFYSCVSINSNLESIDPSVKKTLEESLMCGH